MGALFSPTNWANPGAIGSTTPNTGSFTTLSASSTVSGTGFTNLFAAPPAIGSTTPNTGSFTTAILTAATASTTTATGALTLTGTSAGIGITGNINAGGYLSGNILYPGGNTGPLIRNNSGTVEIRNNANNAFAALQALSITGTTGTFSGALNTSVATASTTTATGALTLTGASAGIGITGNINAGGYLAGNILYPGGNAGPLIDVSAGVVRIRNNANSADAALNASTLTVSTAVAFGTGAAATTRTNLLVPASNVTGITGATAISNIVSISQANYDAIGTKDATTLYFITA